MVEDPFIKLDSGTIVKRFDNLLKSTFINRPNRFMVNVLYEGNILNVHLHDPGRLEELLIPGNEILIRKVKGVKTDYSVTLIKNNNVYTLNDARFHSKIASLFLKAGYRSEVPVNDSRIDFLYNNSYIEVKSCTFVRDGIAMFPDAVSKRATHHLETLMNLVNAGYNAYVLFLIFNENAKSFEPNIERDPVFSHKFQEAMNSGVKMKYIVFGVKNNNIFYRNSL